MPTQLEMDAGGSLLMPALEAFVMCDGFCTLDGLIRFSGLSAQDVQTLCVLNWLQPGTQGRWTTGFRPAGLLKEKYEQRTSQTNAIAASQRDLGREQSETAPSAAAPERLRVAASTADGRKPGMAPPPDRAGFGGFHSPSKS